MIDTIQLRFIVIPHFACSFDLRQIPAKNVGSAG
jgi:hypothetical protein